MLARSSRIVSSRGQYGFNDFHLLLFLSLCILVGTGLNLVYGGVELPWSDVQSALLGKGEKLETLIVWKLRVPRSAVAMLSGAALGLAGFVMQTALRNPLASPDLTGATMGGVLAVVAAIAFFPWIGAIYHPAIALAGGIAASGLVMAVSTNAAVGGLGMILAGAAVSAFCAAGVMLILTGFTPTSLPAYQWLVGSIAGRGTLHLQIMLPWIVLGTTLVLVGRRALTVLELGDEAARAAGVNVGLWRSVLLFASVCLTAAIVSVSGAIAFLGLTAPHLAKMSVRNPRASIIFSPLYGAVLMLLADLLAKTLAAPREIPLGLFLSFLGAPLLVYLIRNSDRFSRQLSGNVS